MIQDNKFSFPKDHLTLEWKGLNLHRVWVLKIASFEVSGSLRVAGNAPGGYFRTRCFANNNAYHILHDIYKKCAMSD